MNPILTARHLSVGYPHTTILQNLDFALYPGDFVCLMGSNGRGKTTLLRTLCGQLKPCAGSITIDRQQLSDHTPQTISRSLAIVLTEKFDLPHMTVRQFVALARAPHTGFWGSLSGNDWKAVDQALEDLQITELKDKAYNQLSDGQKQMVSVARAVAQETPIILLDEPTNFLDMPHKMALLSLLKDIATKRRTAILFSSHDWDLVMEMCTLVWLVDLSGRLQVGMPEEIILWGDLSQSFNFHHIQFSRELGKFIGPKSFTHAVKISGGDPLAIRWTTHALAKEGIAVDQHAAVEVICHPRAWIFKQGAQTKDVQSLYQLIWTIREE